MAALAIVGMLLAAVPAGQAVADAASLMGEAEVVRTVEAIADGAMTFAARAQSRVETGSVPSVFREEVIDLEAFDDAVASADGCIVGCTLPGTASQAFTFVAQELARRGWVRVESGCDSVGTFVKDTGSIGWACVSCSSVDSRASVTIQTASHVPYGAGESGGIVAGEEGGAE